MDKMKLCDAARAMGAETTLGGEISSVVTDSRKIEKDCLFIALVGEKCDGHDFAKAALDAGALACVCSRRVEGCGERQILVEDTERAYGMLAAYNRGLYNIPVVGITGSVGKTTMKDMSAAVLGTKFKTLATLANHNNFIGVPRTCLRFDSQCEAAVVEMGMNHFGEISYLTKIVRPDIGIITKIGVSHIENLGSREGILKAKLEILDGMNENTPLLVNGDDDMLKSLKSVYGDRVRLFGIDNPECECRAENIVQIGEEQSFDIVYGGNRYKASLPVPGIHNVSNACAAFFCGMLLGVGPDSAIRALKDYVPDGHRQKIVKKADMCFIEDCYNASPDSIKASLKVLSSLDCSGRRFAVLGDMLELGDYAKKAHMECGEAAAHSGVSFLFCFGELSKYYIEGAAETGMPVDCRLFEGKKELAKALFDEMKPDDCALFKASHSMKFSEIYKQLYLLLGEEDK